MSSRHAYQCVGFKQLILEALLEVPDHMLPLKDLYVVLQQKEPSLCERKSDWKGTVRHILSAMPNFVRVPDHAKRGVWALMDYTLCETEQEESQEEDQDDQQQQNLSSSPSEEDELPEIVIPSQWNYAWLSQPCVPYQMNAPPEMPQHNQSTSNIPVMKEVLPGHEGGAYFNPSRGTMNAVPTTQQFEPFQIPTYHSQTDLFPLQEIIHQYPDIFRNLEQKQY